MRKLLILVGLLLLSTVIAVPALPVLAQGDPWTCTYDFAEGDGGFVSHLDAIYEDGVWQSNDATFDPDGLIFYLVFPAATDVTSIQATGFVAAFRGDSDFEVYWGNNTPFSDELIQYDITDAGGVAFDETDTTLYEDATGVWFGLTTTNPTSDSYYDFIELEGEGPSPCQGELVRPLIGYEVHEFGIIDDIAEVDRDLCPGCEEVNIVAGFSAYVGSPVYAAASGTVIDVRASTAFDCPSRTDFGLSLGQICGVDLRPETTGEITRLRYEIPRTNLSIPQQVAAYTVAIQSGDREFNYVVANAPDYVQVGLEINAGCRIGETVPMLGVSGYIEVDDKFRSISGLASEFGVTMITIFEDGQKVEFLPELTIEPSVSAPCNVDENFASCVGDGKIALESNWETSGAATFSDPGFILAPGSSVRTNPPLNLDATREPRLIVQAESISGSTTMQVRLGTTTQSFAVSGAATNYTLAAAEHEPDVGTFFTVLIQNTGTISGLRVLSACVQFTKDGEGDPIDPPPPDEPPDEAACTFSNSSFEDGTTGWTLSGSAQTGTGEVYLPDNETISQEITLEAGTYTLNVVAGVWAYNDYAPDDENVTGGIELEYAFPSSFTTIDTKTWAELASNTVVYSVSVVVGSDTTDDFFIRPDISDPPTGARGLAIRAVCIGEGEDGGIPDDPGEISGGIFEATCNTIPVPTGNSISSWFSWHWANLNSFFQCDLMVLLNAMYSLALRQYQLFRWSLLYNQAVMQQSWDWAGAQLFPWLAGHFTNIAVGQVTTINTTGGEEQCGNVFCLLQGLFSGIGGFISTLLDGIRAITLEVVGLLYDLLSTALNAIITMLQQILGFIFSVLGMVVGIAVDLVGLLIQLANTAAEIFQLLIQAVVRLITAWVDATPADIIPSCALDQTSARCIFFYIAERTVFTESGTLFMPAAAGGIYLSLFIWIINRLRRTLMDLGVLS
jgi:hypothetical protein